MSDSDIEASDPVATCFISYNHADKPLAEALAAGLSRAGHRVWIDSGELRIGDSLVAAISGAIDQVDFLVALVSSTSVESNWCQKEVSLAMTGEIAQKGITVLPCRVGDVPMPATLADKMYLEINTDGLGEAIKALDRDMRRHLTPSDPWPSRKRGKAVPMRPWSSPRTSPDRIGSSFDPHVPVTTTGDQVDRDALLETPTLTVEELGLLRGDRSAASARAWLARRRYAGEVFSVTLGGRSLIPAFQLDGQGEPRAELQPIISTLVESDVDGWALWAWLTTPTDLLSGGIPDQLARKDPELVLRAAERYGAA